MKMKSLLSILIAGALSLGACGEGHHDHDHDGHDHETEHHDHDAEDHDEHDHDHEDGDHHDHEHEAAGHNHDAEIPLPDKEAARLGVKTVKVLRGPFAETLRVGGEIERASDGEYVVSAPRSGRFTASQALQIGSHVSAGQSLGSISAAGTEGGDAVQAANARYDAARREVERLKPLVASGAVARVELQKAEAEMAAAKAEAGSGVSGVTTSPGTGVITSVAARTGEFVERGQTIAIVSKNTKLTLRADVPARHAAIARSASSANFRQEGMASAVSLSSNGGRRIGGESTTATAGYIPIRFSFSNDGTAIPGSYAEVWLIGASRTDVLTIPAGAIVEIQGVKYVFEKVHEGRYIKHRVETGGTDGLNIEVLSGLTGGEEIVSEGSRVIRMAEISHIAPPAHTHNH